MAGDHFDPLQWSPLFAFLVLMTHLLMCMSSIYVEHEFLCSLTSFRLYLRFLPSTPGAD